MWVWQLCGMFWLLCIMTGIIIWRRIVYLCLVLYCLYLSNSFLFILAMFCYLSLFDTYYVVHVYVLIWVFTMWYYVLHRDRRFHSAAGCLPVFRVILALFY